MSIHDDETVLSLEDVSHHKGNTPSVVSISLSLRSGRMCGLLGPEGSGTSTVLGLVSGILPPARGTVNSYAADSRPGPVVGAVLGRRTVHPRRTCFNHLRWVAELVGVGSGECRDRLDQVGLSGYESVVAGDLTSAQMMRLVIAAAMLGDPPVMTLDDPLTGLDPETTTWLEDFLRDRCDDGFSVLLSSRLLKEIDRLVDEIVVLGQGRVVAQGSSRQIAERFGWSWIAVDVDEPHRFSSVLMRRGAQLLDEPGRTRVRVAGVSAEEVGRLAAEHRISLDSLRIVRDVNEDYSVATRSLSEAVARFEEGR